MKEKYGFVYIWRDRKHKRYYIGCHWGTEDDGYVSSSPWLMRAYKRRPHDFKRRILQRTDTRQSTFLAEQNWLHLIKDEELKVRYYNLNKHVADFWHQYESKRLSVGEKISASVKAHRNTPEGHANYLAGIEKKRGRPQPADVVAKRVAAIRDAYAVKFPVEQRKQVAKKGSEDHSKKLSDASKRRWAKPGAKEKQAEINRRLHTGHHRGIGRIVTKETRSKISAATKGIKRTPEYVEAMRIRNTGRKQTDAEKIARSEAMKLVWAERKQRSSTLPKYTTDTE